MYFYLSVKTNFFKLKNKKIHERENKIIFSYQNCQFIFFNYINPITNNKYFVKEIIFIYYIQCPYF